MTYEGWNFKERSFIMALVISLLWHFFWFFSITITVSADKKLKHRHPKIVSLGPVLNDTIFKTLVQTKPRYTETFYRRLSDFSSAVDIAPKLMNRYSGGEVVSVPLGKRAWDSVREFIGGDKSSPDFEIGSEMSLGTASEISTVEGDVKGRQILSRPPEPLFPFGVDPSLKFSQVTLEFTVEAQGNVVSVDTAVSSGNADVDLAWTRYLRAWQFSPLPLSGGQAIQKGRVTFRFSDAARAD